MSTGPNWPGRIVRGSATFAAVIGLAALTFDLLAPAYAWRSTGPHGQMSGTTNLIAVGMEPAAAIFIFLTALLCALVALSGWAIARTPSTFLLVVLLFSVGGLVVATLLGGWYIGLSLLPAACVGLVAAGAGIVLYVRGPRPSSPQSA